VESKAWTVFARSNTGIVGSNPTSGMCISVRLFCVCGWRHCEGLIPRPRKPTDYVKRSRNWKTAKVRQTDCTAIDRVTDRQTDRQTDR
jgi:hypothetical protein